MLFFYKGILDRRQYNSKFLMVNFALHTKIGFKVIYFSEVYLFLCCSKITTENGS